MKIFCQIFRVCFALLAFFSLAASVNGQAPSTIAGKTFFQDISSGTYPFSSSGYYLLVPANSGNTYQIIDIYSTADSGGTYSYGYSGSVGTISMNDSVVASLSGTVNFSTSTTGSYSIVGNTYGGYQNGLFQMYAAAALSSIAGKKVYCSVGDGLSPFGYYGSFLITIGASGSTYTITALSGGVINSSGTCSYSTINASTGKILMTDSYSGSSSAYLALSNSFAGGYAIKRAAGGFQVGNFVIVNPSVTITGPTSASIYNTSSSSITLSGSANDNVPIAYLTWTNNRGGSGTAAGTTSWSASNVSLQNGTNIITVTAVDIATVSAQTNIVVVYTPPDVASPSVAITSPTSSSTFATMSPSISLGGTASDNVGVMQVTWSNSRGGNGTAIGTTSWSVGGVALQTGSNVLTVAARDAANNTGQSTLTVIRNLPSLSAAFQNNGLLLQWPTNAAGCVLEFATNFPATIWSSNSTTPTVVSGQFTVTNAISGEKKFYRLKQP